MVACFPHSSIITIWYLDQSFRTTLGGSCLINWFFGWSVEEKGKHQGFHSLLPVTLLVGITIIVNTIFINVTCRRVGDFYDPTIQTFWFPALQYADLTHVYQMVVNRKWFTVQILCASCCCTQSDPSLVRVGRPWLSTATQCYLPIILGMDTDNLCELYRRSTRSTEFDGAHKDIRGPDLPASPWRAIQIWSHYYAQFRTTQSAAAQTTTVLAKEIWPVYQSHSVCHCKAFALDILCLLRSDGQLDMLTW